MGNNLALQNSAFDTTSPGALVFAVRRHRTHLRRPAPARNNLACPPTIASLTLNPGSGVTQSYSGNLSGGTNMTLTMAGAGTQILSGSEHLHRHHVR